jgi:hypothetical protein
MARRAQSGAAAAIVASRKGEAPRVDMRPVAELVPYARNARTHSDEQVAQIAASIREFGWTNPVLVDGASGIIAGHGRVMAARKLGLDEVPCIELAHLTDAQRRAYILADNKLALNAGWDASLLAIEFGDLQALDFDLGLTGFGEEEIAALLADATEGLTDEEDTPEPPAMPTTRAGDLWVLGRHRLLCGDSTLDAERVLPERVGCLLFDPPWDADVAQQPPPWSGDATLAFSDGGRIGDVVNLFGAPTWLFAWDCVSSWYTPGRPLKRMKLCAWYGDLAAYDPEGAHYGEPGAARTVTNTRGSYDYEPNPNGKHLSDVFAAPITREHSEGHQHGKPVAWLRMLIANCARGDVFDPFAGGGSALMACEQLRRDWRGVEIDPGACDSIVMRWQAFTGKQATLDGDGRTFDDVKAGRLAEAPTDGAA